MHKAITTKFIGATDTKGERVSASDGDGNRIIVAWDYNSDIEPNHRAAAEALYDKMGWTGKDKLVGGSLKKGYTFVERENQER